MVRSVPGLEHAVISRYAYAIEYDFLYPDQLERSLRVKRYDNLFTAGQINGTSGYEEAAGQGLVAGMNAAKAVAGHSPVELGRDRSYIGVMIDDLTTKEIVEPYRLFTSRAEYRLSLRQDNADLRLTEFARANGLLPESKYREFLKFKEMLDSTLTRCRSEKSAGRPLLKHLAELGPDAPFPAERGTATPLPFPARLLPELPDTPLGRRVWRELLVEAKYDGYLQREAAEIVRLHRLEHLEIPSDFDYEAVRGLSSESRAKLLKVRPTTLAQAGRIDGVTPADIALLQVKLHTLAEKHS